MVYSRKRARRPDAVAPSLDQVNRAGADNHSQGTIMSWLREPNAEPIPGYRLIEPLGSGGFGEVWKCEAPGGLFKAIKFVYGNLNGLDIERDGAANELRAVQRIKALRHPFLLAMERVECIDGELVIVMELADNSLADVLAECQARGRPG